MFLDYKSYTAVNVGRIYSAHDNYGRNIGRVGKLRDSEVYPGNPAFYATPTGYNPFDTLNYGRQFKRSSEALAWLQGIADAAEYSRAVASGTDHV